MPAVFLLQLCVEELLQAVRRVGAGRPRRRRRRMGPGRRQGRRVLRRARVARGLGREVLEQREGRARQRGDRDRRGGRGRGGAGVGARLLRRLRGAGALHSRSRRSIRLRLAPVRRGRVGRQGRIGLWRVLSGLRRGVVDHVVRNRIEALTQSGGLAGHSSVSRRLPTPPNVALLPGRVSFRVSRPIAPAASGSHDRTPCHTLAYSPIDPEPSIR